MTTISSLWFMILIELLVVTTIVSVLLISLNVMRKQRDRKVAETLIQRVKDDDIRRVEETKKIMLNKFGFEDEKAEEIAVQIGREERRFYQNVINFYLRRDAGAFDNLNISFEGAVEPYRTIEPPGSGAGSGEPVNESEEIKRLQEENKRLSEEIGVTMQTMGRMLSEYSSMFAGGEDGQAQLIKPDAEEESKEETTTEAAEEIEEGIEEIEETEAPVEEPEEDEPELDDDEVTDEAVGEIAPMVEEMDDLSDLDPADDEDLENIKKPENPDDLLG